MFTSRCETLFYVYSSVCTINVDRQSEAICREKAIQAEAM